jgi:hypothetical protein
MIKNIFNKFAAKTFVKKPKVHLLPPKALNLHFPNSINPEFKFLNLHNLSGINFNIKEDKEKNQFILAAQMLAYNNTSEIDIAAFNTMEEAEAALNDVRVALYVPAKSFAKWVVILGMLCGLCCMTTMHMKGMHGLFSHSEKTTTSVGIDTQTPNSSVGMVMPSVPSNANPSLIPPPVNNGEIDKIISQLQEVKQLQSGMNPQQQAPVQEQQAQESPQQPQAPVNPADQLLNGLN